MDRCTHIVIAPFCCHWVDMESAPAFENPVPEIVRRALGDRISLLSVFGPGMELLCGAGQALALRLVCGLIRSGHSVVQPVVQLISSGYVLSATEWVHGHRASPAL